MAKTLYEQVEEEEKLLEVAPELKEEVIEEPETVEETENTDVNDSEDTSDEVKQEPVKIELPPSPENDPQALARAHYESRAAQKRAAELEAEVRALREAQAAQVATPKKVEDPEPNAEEEPLAHMQWNQRRLERIATEALNKAEAYEKREQETQRLTAKEQAFEALEEQFRQVAPDYDDVANHLVTRMAESARMLSPTASPQQIQSFIKNQVLSLADQYAAQAVHPIQALYHLSKTHYGYQPPQREQTPPPVQRPNLSVVENNKKKSAHGLTTGSSKGGTVTAQTLVDIPVWQLDQMPQEEVEAILARSRGNR